MAVPATDPPLPDLPYPSSMTHLSDVPHWLKRLCPEASIAGDSEHAAAVWLCDTYNKLVEDDGVLVSRACTYARVGWAACTLEPGSVGECG